MSRKSRKLCLTNWPAPNYFCEGLESRVLLSSAALVKDISVGTAGNTVTPLGRFGTTVIFAQNDGVHGVELFKSDGTAAGTSMVKDVNPGLGDGVMIPFSGTPGVALGTNVYFSSRAANSLGLWKTDGTAAGTQPVLQSPSGAVTPTDLTTANGKLFFDDQFIPSSKRLYVSDGTSNGTQSLSNLAGIPDLNISGIEAVNNKLFFEGDSNLQTYLYVTDGTAAGTVLLKTGVSNQGMFFAGNKFLMVSGTNLLASDGTAAGTTFIASGLSVLSYGSGSTRAYYMAGPGDGTESLYSTTGTAAGTTLVKGGFQSARPGMGALPNGSELFVGEVNNAYSLYVSNGTSAGTIPLANLDRAGTQNFTVTDVGSVGVFAAADSVNGNSLWASNGTVAGTIRIPASPKTAAGPSNFLAGSPIYFSDDDGTHGQELWKTDGTAAGTAMVADVDTQVLSSFPSHMGVVNGKLWFIANDGAHGTQPWMSDGTAAGTTIVSTDTSITYPYPLAPDPILALGTKAFFIGIDSGGTYRVYDSTGSGVTAVANAAGPIALSYYSVNAFITEPRKPVPFNNATYFQGSNATSSGIWKTDGTVAGTTLVTNNAFASGAYYIEPAGNNLYFQFTDSGTTQVFALNTANQVTSIGTFADVAGGPLGRDVALNNTLYFLVETSTATQLWKSDGTMAGTGLVKDLAPGAGSITVTNGVIYISDVFGSNILLYKSDGTANGTTLFVTVPAQTFTYEIDGFNGKAYFVASNNNGYQSLWYTDGTAAGTYSLMPDLTQSAFPTHPTVAGNLVYFYATDAAHGDELWQTDGTVAGTQVIDINPGPGSSIDKSYNAYNKILQVGNTFFVAANNGVTGVELYRIYNQNTVSGGATNDSITLTQDTDHVHIDWKIGATTGVVAINDPAGLTINGNGGSDVITLVSTNGNPLPNNLHLNGTFTLNGLTGTNPLTNTALDINASTLFISYAGAAADPLAAIRGYLKNGYNAGLWNGTPTSATGVITSATAAANVAHATGIGYADSAEGLVTLPANTIELKYTLFGDTGLASTVGFADFTRMTQHYTQTGMTWARGDFNYDGTVDTNDFNLLKPNYVVALPPPAVAPAAAIALPARSPIDNSIPVAHTLTSVKKSKAHRRH